MGAHAGAQHGVGSGGSIGLLGDRHAHGGFTTIASICIALRCHTLDLRF
jgi:hypothetical protein